jgi:hypothetical protein
MVVALEITIHTDHEMMCIAIASGFAVEAFASCARQWISFMRAERADSSHGLEIDYSVRA